MSGSEQEVRYVQVGEVEIIEQDRPAARSREVDEHAGRHFPHRAARQGGYHIRVREAVARQIDLILAGAEVQNGVGAAGAGEDEHIGTRAAGEGVVVRAPLEGVVARGTVEAIVAPAPG